MTDLVTSTTDETSMPIEPGLACLSPAPSSRVQKRHIVILDDDETMLRGLERILTAAGFRVTSTTSSKQAIEVVVSQNPDAVISDLHMPDLGGNLVLAMLAQAAPRTARVLLTSEPDFATVASLSVPNSVHAFVAKRDTATRLVPVLKELFLGQHDANQVALVGEVRLLARGIVRALALRDFETELHCERVAAWSKRLASELNLSPSSALDLELGALLHDVGKIGVKDAVLLKQARLDEKDWLEMKRHPDLGVALLSDIPALRRAIPVVECHHERQDGKGYPRGLKGSLIPDSALIFQIVDTYDAMVSDRPYRKGRSDAEARAEIARHVGSQFHPDVHHAFSRIDPDEWQAITVGLREPT